MNAPGQKIVTEVPCPCCKTLMNLDWVMMCQCCRRVYYFTGHLANPIQELVSVLDQPYKYGCANCNGDGCELCRKK